MTTAHTPGPWDCDTAGQPLIINGPQRPGSEQSIVALIYDDKEPALGTDPSFNYDEETAAANARLIAAAPDLLACVEDVLDADGDLNVMDFSRYRAAIAKAKGGA